MDVFRARYSLGPPIGAGSHGCVFQATHKLTNIKVAVKQISKEGLMNPASASHFETESQLLSSVNHPFIVRMFDLIETPFSWMLVSEYGSRGDLLAFVNTNHGFSEDLARSVFVQLFKAVAHLHTDQKMVHRDLKLENILIDENGNLKLIDFGFATRFTDPRETFSKRCGSPAYVAPEIVTGAPYTHIIDVWSLGVILYAMIVSEVPFSGRTVQDQLKSVTFSPPSFPSFLSDDLVSLLTGMLTKNAKRRFTFDQIRDHPWLASARSALEDDFTAPVFDPVVAGQLNELGLALTEADLAEGVNTEASVAYKILEREQMNASLSRGAILAPSTPPPFPMLHAGPGPGSGKCRSGSLAPSAKEGFPIDENMDNPQTPRARKSGGDSL
jgi:serine/threonine protein kinase